MWSLAMGEGENYCSVAGSQIDRGHPNANDPNMETAGPLGSPQRMSLCTPAVSPSNKAGSQEDLPGLSNYFPRLASNQNLPDPSLPSS
jgi:hypothetical protein